MQFFRTLLVCGPFLMTTALLCSCQQGATAPQNPRVSQSDLDFITGLTNLAEFDQRVIGRDLDFNPDPRVKSLALELRSRIQAFQAKVQPIAAKNGILPPTNVSLFEQSDMHSRVAALMATSKYDFDQEFLNDEIYGNQEVLRQAEHVINEPPGDPELRALAVEAVGRLKENAQRLESLKAELNA